MLLVFHVVGDTHRHWEVTAAPGCFQVSVRFRLGTIALDFDCSSCLDPYPRARQA